MWELVISFFLKKNCNYLALNRFKDKFFDFN